MMHLIFIGLHILYNDMPSCGADQRFLNEKWSVRLYGDHALVNHVKWDIKAHEGKDYILEHKAAPDAYMRMSMEISYPLAYITMQGITAERKPCMDTVVLVSEI